MDYYEIVPSYAGIPVSVSYTGNTRCSLLIHVDSSQTANQGVRKIPGTLLRAHYCILYLEFPPSTKFSMDGSLRGRRVAAVDSLVSIGGGLLNDWKDASLGPHATNLTTGQVYTILS